MAVLVVKKLVLAGVSPAPVSCAVGGDTLPNTRGASIVRIANGSGGSITATFTPPAGATRPADGAFPAMTLGALAVAVPAGEQRLIGPIPPAYSDSGGNVPITYSAVTSVTIEAFEP